MQTQTGEWWTMLFYDKGPYGRFPNLQPVTWNDNWPVIGMYGKGVTNFKKPNVGREYSITSLPTNDNFRHYVLGMQWGWNHNADPAKWSLIENAGYLRLHTASIVDELHGAKNTLTQRILGYPSDMNNSYGTIKMEIGEMNEGDVAGLAVFQDPYAYVAVKVINGERRVVFGKASLTGKIDTELQQGAIIDQSTIYLRAIASYLTGKVNFYYSLDNSIYSKIGDEFSMQYDLSVFTGNKFALFNFGTQSLGGYVDIDWFSTEPNYSESTYYDDSFKGYSSESLTLTDLVIGVSDQITLLTGSSSNLNVKAVYADGHTEDVTLTADYEVDNSDVLSVVNGRIIALKDGSANLQVSYKGAMGEAQNRSVNVNATTFPLTRGLFNPSIWTTGSFDEATQTLITGQYGFGGWNYNNGVDLSEYKYLVVKLSEVNNGGASFRLFDENSYWSSAMMCDMGNETERVIELSNCYKDNGNKLDPSHIYIAGFWSYGGSAIRISDIYLTNSDDYVKPSGVGNIYEIIDPVVDVYTLSGMCIFTQILRSEAIKKLSPGIYILGAEKIMIID